jgi:23S rRNA pseudouridine1911/1915/1917 synthase
MSSLSILHEDNHLLVVNKPAGLPTQGARESEASVVTEAKTYLKAKYAKPGNVFLGVVSRLDAFVSGVLVLARTSKAAARLSEQFRHAETQKIYWAVVEGAPPRPQAELKNWVRKDEARHCMICVAPNAYESQEARLRYRTLAKLSDRTTCLEIQLETGRKHQIRVQLAHLGTPVLGDTKYGAASHFPQGIALHSRRLTIMHPTLSQLLTFTAPLPKSWQALGLNESSVSGWDRA